jgi:hypothetical protein
MWSLALCAALMGEAANAPDNLVSILTGTWDGKANDRRWNFDIRSVKEGKFRGRMCGQPIAGTFDPESMRIEFQRFKLAKTGERTVIQTYRGIVSQIPDSQPARYMIKGTFQSDLDVNGEKPEITYAWQAEKSQRPPRGAELDALQGAWSVVESQTSDALVHAIPEETGLVQKDSKVVVRGNELVWNGSVVATLANDFFTPDQVQDAGPYLRGPLVLTLPDGTAYWCSCKIKREVLEIVHPHTIGRVGRGMFIWLKRAE